MISVPDEMERLPAPQICRTCMSWVQFKTGDTERQLCGMNKPQHEGCGWHIPRTPSIVKTEKQAL